MPISATVVNGIDSSYSWDNSRASSRPRAERPKTLSNSPENGVESITLAATVSDCEIHASNRPDSNPGRATVIAGQIGRAHNLSRCFKHAVRSRLGEANTAAARVSWRRPRGLGFRVDFDNLADDCLLSGGQHSVP